MSRFPDWLIYILALGAIVWALSLADQEADAPPAPPPTVSKSGPLDGPLLPGPSAIDPEVLVEVGPATSGVGTAFSIDASGWWLTARHVVDACEQVGLLVAPNTAIEAREVRVSRFADLALIRTDQAPEPLDLDRTEDDFRLGQTAFHVGFPQGRPGEAASRLIGRETLIARGRFELNEPVLAWVELGRTKGLVGTLAGMSGGPVFDQEGRVIGVTVAESSRRGRLYTAAPTSIVQLLDVQQVSPAGGERGAFSLDAYGEEADRLRRELSVAQIICVTGRDGRDEAAP